jgi:hypothetical protein
MVPAAVFVLFQEVMMKTTLLVPSLLASALFMAALSSMAAVPIPLRLLGDPAPLCAAERTITITPQTRYVNVEGGQIITFDVGGKTFTWNFDTAQSVMAFDLNQVAPPGLLDHVVIAYIAPNPLYTGS